MKLFNILATEKGVEVKRCVYKVVMVMVIEWEKFRDANIVNYCIYKLEPIQYVILE